MKRSSPRTASFLVFVSLNRLYNVLIEDDALADGLDAYVLVCAVDGGKLLFGKIYGRETQYAVGDVGKTPCICACGEQERHDCKSRVRQGYYITPQKRCQDSAAHVRLPAR